MKFFSLKNTPPNSDINEDQYCKKGLHFALIVDEIEYLKSARLNIERDLDDVK